MDRKAPLWRPAELGCKRLRGFSDSLLPLRRLQEDQERPPQMRLTPPPCLVAALDVLLNDKVALQDIQVWGLPVA
jgi:hypothetical protein